MCQFSSKVYCSSLEPRVEDDCQAWVELSEYKVRHTATNGRAHVECSSDLIKNVCNFGHTINTTDTTRRNVCPSVVGRDDGCETFGLLDYAKVKRYTSRYLLRLSIASGVFANDARLNKPTAVRLCNLGGR